MVYLWNMYLLVLVMGDIENGCIVDIDLDATNVEAIKAIIDRYSIIWLKPKVPNFQLDQNISIYIPNGMYSVSKSHGFDVVIFR